MKTIYALLQKEFLQIFRDKGMLVIIFAIPLIQLVVLAYAATFELKKTPFHLVDFDQSTVSQRLVNDFEATGYFTLVGHSHNIDMGIDQILSNEAQMVLVIPPDFEKKVQSGKTANVQLIINSVNGTIAGLTRSYSGAIIRQFSNNIQTNFQTVSERVQNSNIRIVSNYWYNPLMDYKIYMVPGIIIILVTVICLLLSALNIVREQEIGTLEQLNVTPIKKYQFIAGKLIPVWIITMGILSFSLAVAHFWFNVPFRGNILLIYATAAIYLLAIQGLGLLISTVANTQQQAMFINFFFVMIFLLMGGIFTPVESMPVWAQKVTFVNPIAYFAEIIRMVTLKGSGWDDIQEMVGILVLMALVLLPAGALNYRKRTA